MYSKDEKRKSLAHAIEESGTTPSALSIRIGKGKDYIGDYLRGKKDSLKASEYDKILKVIGKMQNQDFNHGRYAQIDEENSKVRKIASTVLPLRFAGIVQAGIWHEVSAMTTEEAQFMEVAADPRFPASSQFIVEVRGDSMNAAEPIPIKSGCRLKCVNVHEYGERLRSGLIVIVHRFRDGGSLCEATVKRLVEHPDHTELRPESTNPEFVPLRIYQDGKAENTIEIAAVVLEIIYSAT